MSKKRIYKHKQTKYSKHRHYLPKKKAIQFISYDDPRIRKILDIKVYQDYLKDTYTNIKGGADDE